MSELLTNCASLSACLISLPAGEGGGLAPSWTLLIHQAGENGLLTRSELHCSVWICMQTLGLTDQLAGWGREGAGISVV